METDRLPIAFPPPEHATEAAAVSGLAPRDLGPPTAFDQADGVSKAQRTRTRNRRPPPRLEVRGWMTANETALALGCSSATVHRLRGLIPEIEPLPCAQYGRKFVFRKTSIGRATRYKRSNRRRAITL
jgi:hypothetical protein